MTKLMLHVCLPVLAIGGLLTAQEGDKPKAEAPKTDAPKAQEMAKDDAATAADPAIKAIDAFLAELKIDKSNPRWKQQLKQPPKQTFAATSDYIWHIETEVGTVKVRYFGDTAPIHVTSGIFLARAGFYDGVVFHRIIPGFMAQGGDPTGSGSGGPGYQFAGEYESKRRHDKPGILSMANAGPATDGSQFFLTFVPTPHLNGKHTVWGEVIDGMPALKALEGKGSQENNGMLKTPVVMKKTWITVVPKTDTSAVPAKPADGEKKGG
jgi:peptidyl-prolyl cis-trans isomerase B (cyclophilin B)